MYETGLKATPLLEEAGVLYRWIQSRPMSARLLEDVLSSDLSIVIFLFLLPVLINMTDAAGTLIHPGVVQSAWYQDYPRTS